MELVDHLATSCPSVGNLSFASIDSSGKMHKGKTSATAKKDKERNTGSKRKEADSSQRGSRTVSRNIGRTHSDNLGRRLTNMARKTDPRPSLEEPSLHHLQIVAFDFETPPSFGFAGPNAFHEPTFHPAFVVGDKSINNKEKEDANIGSTNQYFFDVAESAQGNTAHNSVSQSMFFAPSKKEKRAATATIDLELRDQFPSRLPLGSNTNGIVGPRNNRRSLATISNQAMAGWTQEMPGFVAPLQQHDDDSGFELALPGSGGDISPLTAYTRKALRPMTRGMR